MKGRRLPDAGGTPTRPAANAGRLAASVTLGEKAMTRRTVLTGIRPTGPLHLGHYAGALENWLRLQNDYEGFFLIADYQGSDYADDIEHVRASVWEGALDCLAAS